jgi:transposase
MGTAALGIGGLPAPVEELERDLLGAGETVVRVPPKLMGIVRKSGRDLGKSDPIDALAVARAALREPLLPTARLEGWSRDVRVLLDHREDLVGERTRMQNRLRWHLHELELGSEIAKGGLDRSRVLAELSSRLQVHQGVIASVARELVSRIEEITSRARELENQIKEMVARLAPTLLALRGCGALTAAKILGETAGIDRFASKAAFAMFNGTAPIPVWSGNRQRHRFNRGGNRQVNAALHRIAITQLRFTGHAREYVQQHMAAGRSKTEAIRALRRQLSNEVYRRLVTDQFARSADDLRNQAA